MFYSSAGQPLGASAVGNRFLFTGQQWYSELGLYDLRNRYYSPDMGRFVQADPIGFAGDAGNLYRYVGNNAANATDPFGTNPQPACDGKGQGCGSGGNSPPSGNTCVAGDTLINETGTEEYPSPNKAGAPPVPPGGGVIGAPISIGGGGGTAGSSTGTGGNGPGGSNGGSGSGPGLGVGPGGLGAGSPGGGGAAPGSGIGLYTGGGGNPGTASGDGGGGSGAAKTGAKSGNPATLRVGDIYDIQWLNQQHRKYGLAHKAELESEYRFIRGIYIGAGIYAGLALDGVGAVEADVLPSYAALKLAGQKGVVYAGSRASYVSFYTYTGVAGIVSGGVANPAINEAVHEIVEFEVGHPGRGIPGLWP